MLFSRPKPWLSMLEDDRENERQAMWYEANQDFLRSENGNADTLDSG